MHNSVDLNLFGSPEVCRNGSLVTGFRTSKAQALLYYLAVTARPHTRPTLAGLFWGDQPEAAARASLSKCLSNLHDLLGDAITIERQTIAFNRRYSYNLDTERFEAGTRHPPTAATLDTLQSALSLYRGDFLEGFYVRDAPEFEQWLLVQRAHYREAAIYGLQQLAVWHESHSDLLQASTALRRLLTLERWREEAHRQLMTLLARSGQRAAALAQFETCRQILDEELGVEPGAETVALEEKIRAGGFEQGRSPHPAHPTERPQPNDVRSNLPIPLASFIGRTQEIASLTTLLRGDSPNARLAPVRSVTVTGAGGCGKTRLAMQVARQLLDDYADGVWWVELAALHEETQVAEAVAKVLDVQQGGPLSLTEVLISNLRNKTALLVLDNCEHLVAGCAELVERLLNHCPRLQILATSREALAIPGEISWLVPSLALPAALPGSLAEYLHYEAIQLFIERASAAQRDFSLTLRNAPAIYQICRQLDGIPLAIELAAARVKMLTVEQMVERLSGMIGTNLDLLTDGGRTRLPRQQTLRATIAWSFVLLNEQEQRLLSWLSVFDGGWSIEGAVMVGAAADIPGAEHVLAHLVDKSLVLVVQQEQVSRYRMLETVRQYAYEQLENMGDVATARDRHLAHFLHLAQQAEPTLRSALQLTWLHRLDSEYANLRAALLWGLQAQTGEEARLLMGAALATELIFYWKLRGDWREGSHWLAIVEQRLTANPLSTEQTQSAQVTSLRAKALYGAGLIAWFQEKWLEARRLLDASSTLCCAISDQTGYYRAQVYQADLDLVAKDSSTAVRRWQEYLTYFRQIQNLWHMAETVFCWGYGERRLSDLAAAASHYTECLTWVQPLGDRWLRTLAISHLGIIALEQGHYDTAWTQIEQRLQSGRELGLKQHVYTALNYMSTIAYKRGDWQLSALLAFEALTVERQAGLEPLKGLLNNNKLRKIALACFMVQDNLRAVKLLAADARLRNEWHKDWEVDKMSTEQLLPELRTRLGDEPFASAWAAGAGMTAEAVLDEVLGQSLTTAQITTLRALGAVA